MQEIKLVDISAQDSEIREEIQGRINEIIKKAAFIGGSEVRDFESNFARTVQAEHTVSCGNGTDALRISLTALGIGEGDEVITVPNTFFATVEAILSVGADVAFVDINESDLLMNPAEIEKKITSKTKAIIPVHLHGFPVQISEISKIARKHHLNVIYDCAQAHLAEYENRSLACFGDVCTYSFFPGKNLGAYGDAGAITTNSKDLYKKIKMLTNHGRNKGDKYIHHISGYNSRMDAIQAAVLNVKLRYLNLWTEQRRKLAALYRSGLKDLDEVILPVKTKNRMPVYHLFVVRAENRDNLHRYLLDSGIKAGLHYPVPLHLQPALNHYGWKRGDYPVAEKEADRIISLPLYPGMKQETVNFIIDKVKAFYEK